MAYDYDKLYGETPDALGAPTSAFVSFFDRYDRPGARVLDIGCGQGRDALFIARRGHSVTGVDLSEHGISQLEAAAAREQLSVTGTVADITQYVPDGLFDVIVIDRTLHMLSKPDRLTVLARLLDHVADNGHVLIADERTNIADFESVLAVHAAHWKTQMRKPGTLFVRRG